MNKSSIYKKNIEALLNRYESDYTAITGDRSRLKNDDVTALLCEVGDKTVLKARKQGKEFQLESAYCSELYLNKWITYIKSNSNISSKLIMFGLGTGIYARKYIEEMTEDHEIIIFEPLINVFLTVLNEYDISDIISCERVHIFFDGTGTDKDFCDFITRLIKYQDANTLNLYVYENYSYLYGERLEDFVDAVKRSHTTMMLDTKFLENSGQLINENFENNMSAFIETKSMYSLEGKGKGIPAIIVGAGPSLDVNIKELKKAEGKAFILVTDSALRTLMRNDITPDCIVTLDPYKDDSYFSAGAPEGVPLVATNHAGWKLVDKHNGPYIFVNSMDKMTNRFTIDRGFFVQSLKSGGSVAHVAFSVAQHMECSPIIFVGMDLAYPNNNTHCTDSVVADVSVEELKAEITVSDIHGNDVLTSGDMLRYKQWIEREIAKFPEKGYIDATEGGALIEGTRVLSLKDSINDYCTTDYNIKEIFDNCETLFSPEMKRDFVKYISDTPLHMRENIKKTDELKEIYEKMLVLIKSGKTGDSELVNLQIEANRILDEIETDELADFTDNIIQGTRNRLFENINFVKHDANEDLLDTINIALEYVTELKKAIREALPYAERMIDKVNSKYMGV